MTTKNPNGFIAYLRVSTTGQEASGLGIEAQREAIAAAVERRGGRILREYVETASGADDERPQLAEALTTCKQRRATLIVAKLDRLSRDVELIARTMKRTPLVVAECVGAGALELHLRAAFAAEEREQIRARTRAALAALKARGVQLGSARAGHWQGREHLRQQGQRKATAAAAAARSEARDRTYEEALHIAEGMPNASLRKIAATLNDRGMTTVRGCNWTATAVARMLNRRGGK